MNADIRSCLATQEGDSSNGASTEAGSSTECAMAGDLGDMPASMMVQMMGALQAEGVSAPESTPESGAGSSEEGESAPESTPESGAGSSEGGFEDATQFNCSVGRLHWKEGWSETKKSYCCNAVGVGCTGGRTKPCVTIFDTEVHSTLRYAAATPGSPCVFGVDPRDEGWHCILDEMAYGSFGWCWTDLQKTTYGACSQDCPLFSEQKILGDRINRVEMKIDRLLNSSGVNYSDINSIKSELPVAPRGYSKGRPPPSAGGGGHGESEEGGGGEEGGGHGGGGHGH